VLGIHYIVPIITAILILLVIVYFSYRQTIAAYPGGGGSYTVATENWARPACWPSALMIDYILDRGSRHLGRLLRRSFSDQQWLLPHTLLMCLIMLAVLAMVNMRG